MQKIDAWEDSQGAVHKTEAEALAAETYIALVPFTKNYEGDGRAWSAVTAAAILANNAQELFDILAGLGYQPSATAQQNPLPFTAPMTEAAPERQAAPPLDDENPF